MAADGFRPASLAEALAIRGGERVRPVAGGTDLMVQHRRGGPVPVRLDAPPEFIGHLAELRSVRLDGDDLVIGAAATLSDLAASPLAPPGLREIIRWFASPAVRNAATVGGNICNASPAGDLLPWLLALDAVLVLRRSGGDREAPLGEFITGPGRHALGSDELLTDIRIGGGAGAGARAVDGRRSAADPDAPFWYYRKVAARRSNALSKLSLYVEARRTDDGALASPRIAVGAVAPTVVRCVEAERLLRGLPASDLPAAADAAVASCARLLSPIDDQRSTAAYRAGTTLRLIRHVLEHELPAWMEQP